jgi:hypothetical protein
MSLMRVLVLLVLFFIAGPLAEKVVAASPIHCSIGDPTTCPSTSDLAWSPGFSAAITRFAGNKKVSYFRSNRSLSEQALSGLGGPPEERVELPGKRYLFSACPLHDCAGNAVAVILDAQGAIQALGFSSFHCEQKCDLSHRHLDFYLHQGARDESLVIALRAWGTGEQIRTLLHDPTVDDRINERTDIHFLAGVPIIVRYQVVDPYGPVTSRRHLSISTSAINKSMLAFRISRYS